MSFKQGVFAELENIVGIDCVFATNTSSLSITEMAGGLEHPERVVGTLIGYDFAREGGRPTLRRTVTTLGRANEGEAKVQNIQTQLGRAPIFAAGNSAGDREMLEWACAGPHAGLAFAAEAAAIDERAVEDDLAAGDPTPQAVAEALAIAKAEDVASRNPGALVIGSDQTLSLEGRVFHKPADMTEAKRHLQAMSGRATYSGRIAERSTVLFSIRGPRTWSSRPDDRPDTD